jgi:hypothetical protein
VKVLKNSSASMITKIVILALLCFSFTISISVSGAKPPYLPTNNPVVVPDGSKGFIVAYQQNKGKGKKTYIQRISGNGQNLWDDKGIELDPAEPVNNSFLSQIELVGDGNGNYYAVWCLKNDLRINKFDVGGHWLWNDKVDLGICSDLAKFVSLSDNNGGVIVVCGGIKGDFWYRKISSDGHLVWPPEKPMSDIVGFDIALDNSGNLLMVYVTFSRSIFLKKSIPMAVTPGIHPFC